MRIQTFILLFLSSTISIAQEMFPPDSIVKVKYPDGTIKKEIYYYGSNYSSTSGFNALGKKEYSSTNYKDGDTLRIDTTYFYVDGYSPKKTVAYSNGIPRFYREFYEDNNPKVTGNYLNGIAVGDWLFYSDNNITYNLKHYENGIVTKTAVYTSGFTKENPKRWSYYSFNWFINGDTISDTTYYFPNIGRNQREVIRKNGILDSTYSEWFSNGSPKMFGRYKNGVRNGEWKSWDEDYNCIISSYYEGKLIKTETAKHSTVIKITSPKNKKSDYNLINAADTTFVEIEHGEDMGYWFPHYWLKQKNPDGKYILFLDDTLVQTAFYKNYSKDSIWTNYYSNGMPFTRTSYKNGKQNGGRVVFYKNGALNSTMNYVNDEIVGEIYEFYESRNQKAIYYYKNGECVKTELFDKNGKMITHPSKK